MICTLYYLTGAKETLDNIANVHESRKQICFTFTNGLQLDVMRHCLLDYSLNDDESEANETCVQDVFNQFDDFVSHFVHQVEDAVNGESRFNIPMNELDSFKKILNTRKKPVQTREVTKMRSLKWR
jgi:hypothetical protein